MDDLTRAVFNTIHPIEETYAMPLYPDWVCLDCGHKYGKGGPGASTVHMGVCQVCFKEAAVTEPRDFGHLKGEWWNHE